MGNNHLQPKSIPGFQNTRDVVSRLSGAAAPRFFLLPEGNGRYPAHEGVGSDALQVEQGPVEKQQQDDVLAEAEAPPTLPDDGDVLETLEMRHKQPNKNIIDLWS